MMVYVLETGVYEDHGVHGVYASPEAAMAAWQPKAREPRILPAKRVFDASTEAVVDVPEGPAGRRHTYTWSERQGDCWTFDADFDDAATITEYEVQS